MSTWAPGQLITEQVLLRIHEFRTVWQNDPQQLKMNPRDVTQLSRERFKHGDFATNEDLNPVPMNEISRGHQFAGTLLDSIPAIAEGTIQIDSETYRL